MENNTVANNQSNPQLTIFDGQVPDPQPTTTITQPIMVGSKNKTVDQLSDARITAAALIAIIPTFLSIIGVHDFVVKRYKQGILHLTMVIFLYVIGLILNAICNSAQGGCITPWMLPTVISSVVMIFLYIWSIIEGVKLMRKRDQTKISQDGTPKTPEQIALEKNGKNQQKREKATWSILAFLTATPSLFLWIWFLSSWRFSGMISDNSSSGAYIWIIGYYYMTIGIPLLIASIAFAIIGFKTNYRWLSIISLFIKIATIAMIISTLFWLWLH